MKLLYLSRADVERVALPMTEIIDRLTKMFTEKGNGRVEMPPKPGIHTKPNAFIHAMPAYIPAMNSAGVKWVSGYPENQRQGLPYITGLMILNDVQTGIPYCVMDCTWVTAQRTGAATALSAKYLARPDSHSLGILACGVQGRSNLEALLCTHPIKSVKAYDVVPGVAEKFALEMNGKFGPKYGIKIEVVKDPRSAVAGMDLVVTSGPILKNPSPIIERDWLSPGSFASAVDFDSYWKGEALSQFDLIATDDHAQFGYYKDVGYFKVTPTPYADLGELVAGTKKGRRTESERTLAVNLGIALEDMAVGPEIYMRAREMGIGTELLL